MNNLILFLIGNLVALIGAVIFNKTISEVYAFLAFNMNLLLFIGFVNLVSFVKTNVPEKKEGTNDTTRATDES